MHIEPDTLPTGHAGIAARLKKGPTIHSSVWVVPGATVYYEVRGSGPVLLLICGGVKSSVLKVASTLVPSAAAAPYKFECESLATTIAPGTT